MKERTILLPRLQGFLICRKPIMNSPSLFSLCVLNKIINPYRHMNWSCSKVPFHKIKNFNKRHKFYFSLESQWQLLSAQITAWLKWKILYCKPV